MLFMLSTSATPAPIGNDLYIVSLKTDSTAMSLQELKAHIIETVSNSDDEENLAQVAAYADEKLASPGDDLTEQEIDALFELARKGREQIDAGLFGTMDDLKKAMDAGMARGRARKNGEQS